MKKESGDKAGHPAAENLQTYHRGHLVETEEDAIQMHFMACAECREAMLELVEFLDGVYRELRWDAEYLVSEWRKIQAATRPADATQLKNIGNPITPTMFARYCSES